MTTPKIISLSQRALQVIAVAHIILGIALPFVSQIDVVSALLIDTMFPGLTLSPEVVKQATYVIAVFGPTIASWGILFLLLVNSYFTAPNKQKRFGLMAALLVWFIGDTLFSMLHGVFFALILNGLVAVAILIPLWFSRPLTTTNMLDKD